MPNLDGLGRGGKLSICIWSQTDIQNELLQRVLLRDESMTFLLGRDGLLNVTFHDVSWEFIHPDQPHNSPLGGFLPPGGKSINQSPNSGFSRNGWVVIHLAQPMDTPLAGVQPTGGENRKGYFYIFLYYGRTREPEENEAMSLQYISFDCLFYLKYTDKRKCCEVRYVF